MALYCSIIISDFFLYKPLCQLLRLLSSIDLVPHSRALVILNTSIYRPVDHFFITVVFMIYNNTEIDLLIWKERLGNLIVRLLHSTVALKSNPFQITGIGFIM